MIVVPVILLIASSWQTIESKDGVTVERRAVAGSPYPELRVSAFCPRSPMAVLSVIWATDEYFELEPHLKRLEVLSEDGDVRVVYAQLELPLVKDRDYVLWNKLQIDPSTGLVQIFFETASDPRRPEDPSHVRVRRIKGSWTVEPNLERNGTDVTYVVHTDPGGNIPTWAANLAQRETAPHFVRAIVERALRRKP